LLKGQQGVFATEDLRREDVAFSEVLPVVSKVPAELKGSDHYIALHHGAGSVTRRRYGVGKSAKERFLILRMESAAHDSIAYHLNSAGSRSNVLDPDAHGANVTLVVTAGAGKVSGHGNSASWFGTPARVTARCLRHVAAGEELLWAYDFGGPAMAEAEDTGSDEDTGSEQNAGLGSLEQGPAISKPPPPTVGSKRMRE
jgi:hypothetical protein